MSFSTTGFNRFISCESYLQTMKQYKYYFVLGLVLHLTIVFLIISQPGPAIEIPRPGNIIQQRADDEEEIVPYSPDRDIFVTQISEREILSKRSIEYLVNEKLLNDIDKMIEHNHHIPSQFRQIEGIYVYGSFLDHRPEGYPMVRILALQKLSDMDSLVCLFEQGERFYLTYTEKYEMCENHGKTYGGYIYSCPLPQHIKGIPAQVTLTILDENQEREINYHSFNLLPLNNHRNTTVNAIGVCLPPLYGDISTSQIIHFIELAKILNASNFFVYKYNVSKNIDILLNYYASIGDVVMTEWMLPETIQDHEIWNKGQLLAIQDCLFSHMNQFRYLLFIDWDEMLIPRTRLTWTGMMRKIEHDYKFKTAAFAFQSAFFDPKIPTNLGENIKFLQLQERTVATSDIRSKVVIHPERVFELGIHHLSKSLSKNFKSVNVDPEIALIHHYRSCDSNFDKSMQCFPTIIDDVIMPYSKRLKNRVKNTQQIMSMIYSHFQNSSLIETTTENDHP